MLLSCNVLRVLTAICPFPQIPQPQEVQDWLRETCRRVAASGVHNGVSVEEWAGVVDDAFPPSEEDRTRHLRVQDFSDTTAVTVPPEVRHRYPSKRKSGGFGLHCRDRAARGAPQPFTENYNT